MAYLWVISNLSKFFSLTTILFLLLVCTCVCVHAHTHTTHSVRLEKAWMCLEELCVSWQRADKRERAFSSMLGTEIKALCKYFDRRQLCYNRVRADLLCQDLYWVLVPLLSTSVTLVELFISLNPVSSPGRDSDNAS